MKTPSLPPPAPLPPLRSAHLAATAWPPHPPRPASPQAAARPACLPAAAPPAPLGEGQHPAPAAALPLLPLGAQVPAAGRAARLPQLPAPAAGRAPPVPRPAAPAAPAAGAAWRRGTARCCSPQPPTWPGWSRRAAARSSAGWRAGPRPTSHRWVVGVVWVQAGRCGSMHPCCVRFLFFVFSGCWPSPPHLPLPHITATQSLDLLLPNRPPPGHHPRPLQTVLRRARPERLHTQL